MNTLLVFFAIPVAIVVLSIILETLLHNPYKVAGIFFSILLVTVFAIDTTATLIALLIVYTVLSLITAYLVKLLCERRPFPCYRNYCNTPVNNALFEGDEEPNNDGIYYSNCNLINVRNYYKVVVEVLVDDEVILSDLIMWEEYVKGKIKSLRFGIKMVDFLIYKNF